MFNLFRYCVCVVFFVGFSSTAICAEASAPQVMEPLVDGYYPMYPVTQARPGIDADQIKRGEYLAKLGDCIACHTNVEGKTPAFAGGLPLATPFGTFYSPNITPDKETGIGSWTEQDFIRALKDGRDPHGRNYYPVFPYVYFSKMTDDDAKDLYAYFMSIPPVHLANKPLPFPFNLSFTRFTLWGWNILFFFPEYNEINKNPAHSDAWNRGRYIVDTLGHCSMCHTPLNIFGAAKNRFYLTGAFIDGYWAPNVTKFGLRDADHNEVVDVFKNSQLINQKGSVAGPMAEVNHNSLRHLTLDDQKAIAEYLKTVESEEPFTIQAPQQQSPEKRGKQIYVEVCSICHQDNKMGAPVIGNGPAWFHRLKDNGLTGLYRHAIRGFNSMPVRGACVTCSDKDIQDTVDYILGASLSRTQWEDVKKGGTHKYPVNGKKVYDENCALCHQNGANGAPKIGDKAQWSALLETRTMDDIIYKTLHSDEHPRNAGCEDCSTEEVIEAVKYIISQSSDRNYTLW